MTKQELFEKVQRSAVVELEIKTLASSATAMLHMQKIQTLGVEYQELTATFREVLSNTLLKGVSDEQ
ncbi:hypothetical protein [Aliivibrio logei]|uniref:Uncharacterized protein n=1 Tax=Aliivibrio logei TaxID=688 RepID=A0A1B9NUY3_ALILO|nr:hypothetical protein [Aliivibrio logei]OCH17856.1 hypothetical protein A6E04_17790 [Aliivibrio logei]